MRNILTAVLVLLLLGLAAGNGLAAKYRPGTYKGSDPGLSGKKHPGNIEVEVTVDEDSITDIKLIQFEQHNKGMQGKHNARAKEQIPVAILRKQSLAVDSVAKASMSSVGIELAVAQALQEATVAYHDGKYKGRAKGYNMPPDHPGEIVVEVTIEDGRISDIKLLSFKQTAKGKQGKRNIRVQKTVPAAIVEAQSTRVDSIAKASFASSGIKIAVARALEKAR
ncbi:MAG: hypothetical protein CSB24_05685 [Deltaproteobacteria bacterium]|nr:MAG: hypothetical protein CSB24_05685 [Deltaproteobacteria bacterium]